MSDEVKAHSFSEHHQRYVRTTFQYIDKLLSEAEHTMADAGSQSPFRMQPQIIDAAAQKIAAALLDSDNTMRDQFLPKHSMRCWLNL